MKKIEQFQITSMSISGFKSYEKPTELTFGNPTVITGGNGRGKTSIADAIAFAVTGLPFFGERGLDRLHNEKNPDVVIQMRFVDENGITHDLTRIRRNNDMSIYYDGHILCPRRPLPKGKSGSLFRWSSATPHIRICWST